ncbi:ABC transporter permease subunit [Bacillus sp. FJAT-49732]|uniref:ABC transporter permease subunit n=1 Tax=Lederbergia citrisecunda TaxID=2833583 RepID=A0A942YL15_9BACI|nr:ABC transporter permease subunit [Lederbergia citrisecunda]MBS4200988.1 ABC transporter permease subunit [Lederbergia citrisecunda]
MSTFLTLLNKELLEAWRDKKLIWLPIVLSVLAISQPITQYYMPQILDAAGNLPEGTIIEFPVPTGAEVLAGTLSQIGTIGTAIFVLSVMGSIVQERNSGALSLVMARPVQAYQYITSKWVANAIILLASFIIGYGLSYYYTNILFEEVEIKRFFASLGVYSIWILFTLTATLLAGTVFKKVGGVAGASLLTVAALALCGSLFPKFMGWSPSNALNHASSYLASGTWGDAFGTMMFSSIALILCVFGLTVYLFKKYESY